MIRVVNWKEILPKFEPSINLSSTYDIEYMGLALNHSYMVKVGDVYGILEPMDDGILVRHVVGKGLRKALIMVQEYFQCPIYCHAEGSRARLYKRMGFIQLQDGRLKYDRITNTK